MQTQRQSFDEYLASVTSQVDNIKSHNEERKNIFRKCLKDYKQHLQGETLELEKSQEHSEHKNHLIRQAYSGIFDSVHQDSDNMFRILKRTFETKKVFWKQTIEQFIDSPDVELKKGFYQQKNQAEQMSQQAVLQRRQMSRFPYNKLVSLGEKNKGLTDYQLRNRMLQRDVNLGTLIGLTRPEWNIPPVEQFDNKQNSIRNWGNIVQQQRPQQSGAGIIRHFMKS